LSISGDEFVECVRGFTANPWLNSWRRVLFRWFPRRSKDGTEGRAKWGRGMEGKKAAVHRKRPRNRHVRTVGGVGGLAVQWPPAAPAGQQKLRCRGLVEFPVCWGQGGQRSAGHRWHRRRHGVGSLSPDGRGPYAVKRAKPAITGNDLLWLSAAATPKAKPSEAASSGFVVGRRE